MPPRVEKLLVDIRLACEETQEFCRGKQFDDFLADRLLQLAVERQFEIIGEAIYRLERIDEVNLLRRIPDYRKIIGLRNIIAHGYDIVDDKALWDFVTTRIPELLRQVETY
jgi:uncharacterized protein with HEPN domain